MDIEVVQKSTWHKRYVLLFLAASAILASIVMARIAKGATRRPVRQEPVVANTWGWATIKGGPVPVGYRQSPGSHDNIGLMQVEFEMNSGVRLPALVNVAQMEGKISPATNNWKVGDQVMVVCISEVRRGLGGAIAPSVTYFVIDYSPQ